MSRAGALRAAGWLAGCSIVLSACGSHTAGSSLAASAGSAGSANAARASVIGGDWTRFGYDAGRSGAGPTATGITANNLGALSLRRVRIDGTADSSPIELRALRVRGRVRDVVVLTTSYGETIALDVGTGARLWEYRPPGLGGYAGTAQITNASPAADPGRRYVFAATPDGFIRKLPLATGREVRSARWPARITYDATREKIASALNLSGNAVVAVTGGYYGDAPTYQGHLVTIDRTSGRVRHVFNSLCSNRRRLIDPPSACPASDSAIWARAGAVIEPGSGRILIATGNGPFNGFTEWGSSVLELSPAAGRLLHNWTPTNHAQLTAGDTDVGSTAPALLPARAGRRLAVQGGKDAQLHLLDLDRLDGTSAGAGPRLGGQLQQIASPGGGEVLSAPAVWSHAGHTYVFVADDAGTGEYILQGGSAPRLRLAASNTTPGTSPVLAGGLLYVYDERGGRLEVYEPTQLRRLASLRAASGHWNSPIVVGGRIILPVGNANDHATRGAVEIYHLPGR